MPQHEMEIQSGLVLWAGGEGHIEFCEVENTG